MRRALRTLRFALQALWVFASVALRRIRRGPLHPGWPYRTEAILELVRIWNEEGIGKPVERLRRGLPPARIHPKVKDTLSHERGALAGRPTEIFTPAGWKAGDPTLLYFHGGGYIVCSPATHRDLVSRIAQASGARAIAVDYRKAPEHPFPAPIDDCEAAYLELLGMGVPPSTLFVGGDSAGGGLTLAVLQRLRGAGAPLPKGAVLLSPWVDLEFQGPSIRDNAPFDYLRPQALAWGASQYLGGADPRDPLASAVRAELSGLPPLLIQSGSAELFLSENQTLAERARAAGVHVTHEIEQGMVHVFQAFASFLPGCEPAIGRIGAFVRDRHLAA
jgi:acetyl esterase/lipase